MKLTKSTVQAIIAGVIAALLALSAALGSGDGINASEWIGIVLAGLAGSGLLAAAKARSELRATKAQLAARLSSLNDKFDREAVDRTNATTTDLESLSGRIGELESSLATSEANNRSSSRNIVDMTGPAHPNNKAQTSRTTPLIEPRGDEA